MSPIARLASGVEGSDADLKGYKPRDLELIQPEFDSPLH